jgi:glycosyltransferase involved in cell wall biosynthesis
MVTPLYLPHCGGVENHVSEVSQRLAAAGVDVTILTTDRDGVLPTRERVGDVEIRRVRAWPKRRDYHLAPAIAADIARGRWDLVHVQSYHTFVAPLAMLGALRARVPYVVTFHAGGHSSHLRGRLRRPQLSALRPLLGRAERLVALAPFEVEEYGSRLSLAPSRFAVIPNGTDLPRAVPTSAAAREGLVIASVGRLERYKGHHRILAALPHIATRRPDARLWIAGTGPYERRLRRLAGQLGVQDRVDFEEIPPQDRARMAAELAQAAIVVLLSERETQPMAALEALGLGRRLLVADAPGLSDLAARGLARAIPLASTPVEVANAVLDELARADVPQPARLPSWDDCAMTLLDLYREICREGACAS